MADITIPDPGRDGIHHRGKQIYTPQEVQALLSGGWKLTPATMAHKITRGKWIAARHLLHVSSIVATEIAKGGARILVTMAPRHGKSEFLSVHTSEWFLERWPNKYVMNLTYGLDLATDFSLKVRTTFMNEENHDLLSTRIRRDKMRVDRFLTTEGGGLTAAGLNGVITGRGADLMLIDDYVKNAEDALSKVLRDKTWEWFKSTAYTRLEPGSSLIILATRWDTDDLIGRCLEEMPEENWLVINLPAIAMANDPLGRQPGEALWPERFNVETLRKIKAALGNYWWMAMYQQDPLESMTGADLGDKLKVCSAADLPHLTHRNRLRTWDLAATPEGGDYTVGMLCSTNRNDPTTFFIEDIKRFQKSSYNTELIVKAVAEGDGVGTGIRMEQEPGSAGKTVIEHYEFDVLPHYDFKAERATGPIEVRAQPFLAGVEAGNVVVVDGPHVKALRKELNGFPGGDHDDQIIAAALGYKELIRNKYRGLVWGRRRDKEKTENKIIPIRGNRARQIAQQARRGGSSERTGGLTWRRQR